MAQQFDLEPGDDRLFTAEAVENVDLLESTLLVLERGPVTPADVDVAFRAAHTLKGAAAMIAHQRMADLAHVMEDLLGVLRSGADVSASRIAGELLTGIDALRELVDEVSGSPEAGSASPLTQRLRALHTELVGGTSLAERDTHRDAGATLGSSVLRSAVASGLAGVGGPSSSDEQGRANGPQILECRVDPDSQWRAVRLLQIVMEASSSGHLISSDPDVGLIETGRVGDSVRLTLDADVQPDFRGRLLAIEEVVSADWVVDLPPAVQAEVEAASLSPDSEAEPDIGEPLAIKPSERSDNRAARSTIRIDVARLDELLDLVGELLVHRTRLHQLSDRLASDLGNDPVAREAGDVIDSFESVVAEVQERVTGLRMVPVATVLDGLPRIARDVANRRDRQVEVVIEGREVELDRSLLEGLSGALGHVVRNAVDHGIEPPDERIGAGKDPVGRIRISAAQVEGRVRISVSDDGRGIDRTAVARSAVAGGLLESDDAVSDHEALELVFRPGLSTASAVTEISGRGVGLDAVRAELERLGGTVGLTTEPGNGTTVTLDLPLTLAIFTALLVRSGGITYALPMASVAQTLRPAAAAITTVAGESVVMLSEVVLRLHSIGTTLGLPDREPRVAGSKPGDRPNVVVLGTQGRQVALVVDELLGKEEIMLKSITGFMGRVSGIGGATLLPDGGVALVVDVNWLLATRGAPVSALRRTA
jgi:two-component system chemotaxis sensor kinase CheA